jgi:hypothetical protein
MSASPLFGAAHVNRRSSKRCSQCRVNVDGRVYTYHQRVLDVLAGHGLIPTSETSPQQLRDAVRDLYKYEIRRLRDRLIAREFLKRDYAGLVVKLRQRYWLLSIPTELWTLPGSGSQDAHET